MTDSSPEILSRRLLSYGSEVAVFGQRPTGKEEVFVLFIDGKATGETFQDWPSAFTRFREAVLERQAATMR